MYNVLFPSGRVLSLGTIEVAEMYCQAYNGTLLPTGPLDNVDDRLYNDFVVNDMEVL